MTAPRFHPLVRLLLCALGLTGVLLFVVMALFAGNALASAWTNRNPAQQLVDFVTRYALPLALAFDGLGLLWIAWCRRHLDGRSLASLGLRFNDALPNAARGALAGTLAIALLWSVLWLSGAISVVGASAQLRAVGWSGAVWPLLGYASAFVLVGAFEETLFRGYVLHNLTQWLGWRGAVTLQAILFALMHLGNVAAATPAAQRAALGALPSLALIAVFFALCFGKTGSLWFPIGFHFAWNFCLGCVFSLPVSGVATFHLLDVHVNAPAISGGAFGAEGSLLLLPILAALLFLIAREPDHPQALRDLASPEAAPGSAQEVETSEVEASQAKRPNRFRTKFGSARGFSAETWREMRDLQAQGERQKREP